MNTEPSVSRWRADEERIRARLGASDVIPPERAFGDSGMALFEAIFAGRRPSPPIGETLDFVPIRIEPGAAVFQGRPQRRQGPCSEHAGVNPGRHATLATQAL